MDRLDFINSICADISDCEVNTPKTENFQNNYYPNDSIEDHEFADCSTSFSDSSDSDSELDDSNQYCEIENSGKSVNRVSQPSSISDNESSDDSDNDGDDGDVQVDHNKPKNEEDMIVRTLSKNKESCEFKPNTGSASENADDDLVSVSTICIHDGATITDKTAHQTLRNTSFTSNYKTSSNVSFSTDYQSETKNRAGSSSNRLYKTCMTIKKTIKQRFSDAVKTTKQQTFTCLFIIFGIIILSTQQRGMCMLSRLPNDLECFLKTNFNSTFNYASLTIMNEHECGGDENCYGQKCNEICQSKNGSSIAAVQQDMCACLSLQDGAHIFEISPNCCRKRGETLDGQFAMGPHGIRMYNISLNDRKINTSHVYRKGNACDSIPLTKLSPAPLQYSDDNLKKCNTPKCSIYFSKDESDNLKACTGISQDADVKLLTAFVRNSKKRPELCQQHCHYQSEFTEVKYKFFMVSVVNFDNGKNLEICTCSEQLPFEVVDFKLCSECQTNEDSQGKNCSNESIWVSSLIYCMNTQIDGTCCSINAVNSLTTCDNVDIIIKIEKGWWTTMMTILMVVVVLLSLLCIVCLWIRCSVVWVCIWVWCKRSLAKTDNEENIVQNNMLL